MAAHVDMRNDAVVVAEEKSMALEDPSGDKHAITGDNAVHGKFTAWLALTAVICFLGSSFQFGYNLGVINAPKDIIEKFFKGVNKFEDIIWPTAVAIFAIGGMVGALLGPNFAKKFGRKKTLMANNALAIVGGILLALTKPAHHVSILIIGRILVGINSGINTVVAPMYLSEVAPVNLRGSLGTLNQLGIVSGILISQVLGLSKSLISVCESFLLACSLRCGSALSQRIEGALTDRNEVVENIAKQDGAIRRKILGTSSGWPYLFGITAMVAFLQLLVLPFCPESPRYSLIIKGDEAEAERALKTLRGVDDVSADIAEMKIEKEQEDAESKVSILGLFKSSTLRRPLIISIVMQLSQQLNGINGVLFYSTDVFQNVGLSLYNAQAATTGVGAVSVVMTLIVVKLVEVQGRRVLMLWGLGGMFIFYILMTVAFVEKAHAWAKWSSIVLTLILVLFFQLGPGPIPWFIVAELFSQGPLPAAISVSGMVNWFSGFIVGLIFPGLQKLIKPYTFVPFIVLVLLFWLFTYFFVPETKGRTVNDIMKGFEKQSYGSTDIVETNNHTHTSKADLVKNE